MTRITGAEALAASLVDNGITDVFNIAGLGMWKFVEAVCSRPNDLRYITAVNETTLGLAADGYGRAAGRPALVNVYFTSGTALGLVGLATAWADRVPMLFTTTTADRRLAQRDPYAAVPHSVTDMSRQFVKWSWEVPTAARIPEAISRAVTIATTPPMGPVHLAFPMDIYEEEFEVEPGGWLGSRPALDGRARAVDASLVPVADALVAGARVVILAGGAVGRDGAQDALASIAEQTGALVLCQSGRPGYLPVQGAPAWFGGTITDNAPSVTEADVVLSVGFEFGEVPGGRLPFDYEGSQRRLELVDDARSLGKHFQPHVGVVGSIAESLARLAELVGAHSGGEHRPCWAGDQGSARAARVEENIATLRADAGGQAPLLSAVTEFVRAVPDACVVDHANFGTVFMDAITTVVPPSNYFSLSQMASAQGWAVPAAIGVCLARPGRRVLAVVGDGGFMFTSGALYTAARLKLPLTVIVLNNGGWGGGGYNYRVPNAEPGLFLGGFDDPPLDASKIAAGMGVYTERVDNDAAAAEMIRRAVTIDGPSLLEVAVPPGSMELIRKRRTQWRGGMSG